MTVMFFLSVLLTHWIWRSASYLCFLFFSPALLLIHFSYSSSVFCLFIISHLLLILSDFNLRKRIEPLRYLRKRNTSMGLKTPSILQICNLSDHKVGIVVSRRLSHSRRRGDHVSSTIMIDQLFRNIFWTQILGTSQILITVRIKYC